MSYSIRLESGLSQTRCGCGQPAITVTRRCFVCERAHRASVQAEQRVDAVNDLRRYGPEDAA